MSRLVTSRLVLVVVVALAAGCSVARRAAEPVARPAPASGSAPIGAIRRQPSDLMLVRRGELAAEVEDLNPPLVRSHDLTASLGGYIASESRDDRSVSVSMRVPEPKLDVALDSLSALGTGTSRKVPSQDVTEEALGVDARVPSHTAARER